MTAGEKKNTLNIVKKRIVKAMKRRVEEEIRRRESRVVERDMEGFFEHGLGAAHRPYVMIWRE